MLAEVEMLVHIQIKTGLQTPVGVAAVGPRNLYLEQAAQAAPVS